MQRLITQFFVPNVRALLIRNGQVISGAGVGVFMAFDEEYEEHWEEAGKVNDAVLKVLHGDGRRSQRFFAYKKCLTLEEGKVLYQNPVGDAAYLESFTLRKYSHT